MINVPFVDLGRQHAEVEEGLFAAFARVLEDGSFTLGGEVEALERDFAEFVGVRYAAGVGSGTDALHFALRAVGVGPGDEVITAVNTFAATAEAIVAAGATPVFVDVDDATLLMDLDAVSAAVNDRTAAIIPVHLYGQCVDMWRVRMIAQPRNIRVVEDACQAHGASRAGLQAGAAGDAGCFSFYPSKNLGALGDGGIVTTNDEAIARRVRLLRSHGEDASRMHVEVGYTSRLHGMQAAMLRAKLPMLPIWNEMRRSAAARYGECLGGNGVRIPSIADDSEPVFHLYCARVRSRDAVRRYLGEHGVQTGIHYPLPLHLEPAFEFLGGKPGDFPVAEKAAQEIISLPMYPYLTDAEIESVAGELKEALSHV